MYIVKGWFEFIKRTPFSHKTFEATTVFSGQMILSTREEPCVSLPLFSCTRLKNEII